jgi:hypothetical protein
MHNRSDPDRLLHAYDVPDGRLWALDDVLGIAAAPAARA